MSGSAMDHGRIRHGERVRTHLVAVLLAFTGGAVDTIGFIGLFGLFTAHVTGNFVLIGASLNGEITGLFAKLLALPTFVLAVALSSLYARRCVRRGVDAAGPFLLTQAALLLGFMALGLALSPFVDGDQPTAIVTGMVGVLAMGVQNAAARTVFSELSPTTVMTGNVTQLVMDATAWLVGSREPALASRMAKFAPPIAAFAAGALLGALAFMSLGFWALLFPIAAVLTVFAMLITSG